MPSNWFTPRTHQPSSKFADVIPSRGNVCPDCGVLELDGYPAPKTTCEHPKLPAVFLPAPFLFCPSCGIVHDRRSREFNKLFTFGSVGRSTATDVLISAEIRSLPDQQRKVIAFSDNRQDTALQAAHMNSLHSRFTFRRALFSALQRAHAIWGTDKYLDLANVGQEIFETLKEIGQLPEYRKDRSRYRIDRQADERYMEYLIFLTLQELRGTHRRTHQNLEDVGLLSVAYAGLDLFSADNPSGQISRNWRIVRLDLRQDLLYGFLDLMRQRQAIHHPYIYNSTTFRNNVLRRISESVYSHDEEYRRPIGYSDEAPESTQYTSVSLCRHQHPDYCLGAAGIGCNHSQSQ